MTQSLPNPRPRAATLATEGITKIFGAMRALDDVSVQIDAGSFHALLGENGAGKSTLVKCIMGFYGADAGAVLLDGARMSLHPICATGLIMPELVSLCTTATMRT